MDEGTPQAAAIPAGESGEMTLDTVRETFDQWRVFEKNGRCWAMRSGTVTAHGPQSLIQPLVWALTAAGLAEQLSLQEWLRRMPPDELEAVWREGFAAVAPVMPAGLSPRACTRVVTVGLSRPPVVTGRLPSCRGWDGYYDSVLRRKAWEAAHGGGSGFRKDGCLWQWLWDDEPFTVGGVQSWELGMLLNVLDQAEAEGRCPMHGPFSAALGTAS